MAFGDYAGPMTTDAAGGAATGFALGGPVGGVIGGGLGLIGGFFQGDAARKQRKSMEDARRQLADLQRQQYAQRMADVQRALQFFGPARSQLERMYGTGAGGPDVGGGYFAPPEQPMAPRAPVPSAPVPYSRTGRGAF